MKRIVGLMIVSGILIGGVVAQEKGGKVKKQESVRQEEVRELMKSGFSNDPRFAWKLNKDEAQKICSQYPSRESMPASAIQKVIELSTSGISYPQWGIYWGDWKEGKKLVESPRGGRFASYGFSDNPADKGGNCYACHLIEKGMPGGTMGPNLYQYGKRWNITKENMNSPETIEKLRIVYNIIYNSWSAFPCSSMPRFGYHGSLSSNDVANIVAFLLHPESPVNK